MAAYRAAKQPLGTRRRGSGDKKGDERGIIQHGYLYASGGEIESKGLAGALNDGAGVFCFRWSGAWVRISDTVRNLNYPKPKLRNSETQYRPKPRCTPSATRPRPFSSRGVYSQEKMGILEKK